MSSIYLNFLGSKTWYSAADDQQVKKAQYNNHLGCLKAVVSNVELTANALLQGGLSRAFDPIVHDNSCLVRGLAVAEFASDPTIYEEAKKLKTLIGNANRWIDKLKTDPKLYREYGSLRELVEAHPRLQLPVSEKFFYLQLAHLATVTKTFVTYVSGKEVATIDIDALRRKLKVRLWLDIDSVKTLVDCAQRKISKRSVHFIQEEAAKAKSDYLSRQLFVVKTIFPPVAQSKRYCASSFYNLKMVFLRAKQQQIPILVREHQKSPLCLIFRAAGEETPFLPLSQEEVGTLHPLLPILVIECFLPEGFDQKRLEEHLDACSLEDLALASVALTPQYSIVNEDPDQLSSEAEKELACYRAKGEAWGCRLPNPQSLTAIHIHAATLQEEIPT